MTSVLGRDWAARMAARFGGRLYVATFLHSTVGSYDANDPSGSPARSDTTYDCEGIALSYKSQLVDGERITKRDYRVMILTGSIKLDGKASGVLPVAEDIVNIPPPGQTVAKPGVVIEVEAITEAFVTLKVRGPGNA